MITRHTAASGVQPTRHRSRLLAAFLTLLLLSGLSHALPTDTPTETGPPECPPQIQTAIAQIHAAIDGPIDTPNCDQQGATLAIKNSDQAITLQLYASQLPIAEPHRFYGLASYYNAIRLLNIDGNDVSSFSDQQPTPLNGQHLLAAVGRFEVELFDAPGAIATIDHDTDRIELSWPPGNAGPLSIILAKKTELSAINPDWSAIRYSHLWSWLASLSMAAEWALVQIQRHVTDNWGWSIVLFAILLKLLLLPINLMTVRFQREVSRYQAQLAPQLDEIKAQYDGEEAHQRIMAAHKALGITPFYTLKPVLGSFIQVPVLIAVFNALGEMPQLAGASFLWVSDLAYPDAIATLPTTIPMLGNQFNLLPIVMTLITVLSTLIFDNRHVTKAELKRQKRNLYLMAAAFLILFYPFPAAMVLYWTLFNLLQAIQQQLFRI